MGPHGMLLFHMYIYIYYLGHVCFQPLIDGFIILILYQ